MNLTMVRVKDRLVQKKMYRNQFEVLPKSNIKGECLLLIIKKKVPPFFLRVQTKKSSISLHFW